MGKKRWTDAEIASLISQVVRRRRRLPEILIAGRTPAAINNYRRFLREKGRLGNAVPVRKQRTWTAREVRALKFLVTNLHFSSLSIVRKGLLTGRSVDSVGQMMRRLHLAADPERSRRMKRARRLSTIELTKLKAYLLGPGRKVPSQQVCRHWSVSPSALRRHRRLLGASLSWKEARAGSEERPRISKMRDLSR